MALQLRRIPQYFRPKIANAENWSVIDPRDRLWEDAYRSRWAYDKVVRSTHGVNCTGSCSLESLREGWDRHLGDLADRLPD